MELITNDKIDTLKTIAKSGHFKNRLLIAQRLNQLKEQNKLFLIDILYNDKVENISLLAIEESNKLNLTEAQKDKFIDKIEYWTNKRKQSEKMKAKNSEQLKNSKNFKRKFSDGESYQNMKKMLKKPMNTGKWF